MKQLHLLREATMQLNKFYFRLKQQKLSKDHQEKKDHVMWLLNQAAKAQKFILPENGLIFADKLKGLPDVLRLPFPEIIIEYEYHGDEGDWKHVKFKDPSNEVQECPKRIVYAREEGNAILVTGIFGIKRNNMLVWSVYPGYLQVFVKKTTENLNNISAFRNDDIRKIYQKGHKTPFLSLPIPAPWVAHQEEIYDCVMMDLGYEAQVMCELLEALNCANVSQETLPKKKFNKALASKFAIPYDEYRILMVNTSKSSASQSHGGSHAPPREHLRRGHIRRLANGKQIWVNACVVNAGVGGKLTKAYGFSGTDRIPSHG